LRLALAGFRRCALFSFPLLTFGPDRGFGRSATALLLFAHARVNQSAGADLLFLPGQRAQRGLVPPAKRRRLRRLRRPSETRGGDRSGHGGGGGRHGLGFAGARASAFHLLDHHDLRAATGKCLTDHASLHRARLEMKRLGGSSGQDPVVVRFNHSVSIFGSTPVHF